MKRLMHIVLAFLLYPLTAAANPLYIDPVTGEVKGMKKPANEMMQDIPRLPDSGPELYFVAVVLIGMVGLLFIYLKKR